MSPERKRRYLDDLVTPSSPDRTVIEARYVENHTRYKGTHKDFIVTLTHHIYRENPQHRRAPIRGEGWGVRTRSIDLYTGSGAVYDTLEQARAVFDAHVAGCTTQTALF